MMKFVLSLDWKGIVEGTLSNLIPTAIAGLIGYLLVNQMAKYIRISQKMKSYGFKAVETMKNQTVRDMERLCQGVYRLDMIYVSGYGFFKNNEIPLKEAMDRGMEIRFLCARKGSEFLSSIENLEVQKGLRSIQAGSISDEIQEILDLYIDYLRSGKMKIRFYSSEYRLPFILSHSFDRKNRRVTKAWLTITLPPYKAVRNFVLSGERHHDEPEEFDDVELNFIEMMEEHFDYVWHQADSYLIDEEMEVPDGE